MSEYGCGRIHPKGGAKNAKTNDETVAIKYLFRMSSSAYNQTGVKQMSKIVAKLIRSDLGSWPAVLFVVVFHSQRDVKKAERAISEKY